MSPARPWPSLSRRPLLWWPSLSQATVSWPAALGPAREAVATQLPAQPGPPGAEFESHAARPDRDGITPHGPGRGEGPSTRRRSACSRRTTSSTCPTSLNDASPFLGTAFCPGVRGLFTNKALGWGASTGRYASLNLSYSAGDDAAAVRAEQGQPDCGRQGRAWVRGLDAAGARGQGGQGVRVGRVTRGGRDLH